MPTPVSTQTEVEKPVPIGPAPEEVVVSPAPDASMDSQATPNNQSGNFSEGSNTTEIAPNMNVPQGSSKAADKPAPTKDPIESQSTKPAHSAAQSNTKAKRRQANNEDASTPKVEPKGVRSQAVEATPKMKKRFDWAKDTDNSRGTDSHKSDARMFVDVDTASETGSSNDSLTDPTPPNTAWYKKKLISAGKKPSTTVKSMETVISALDFENLWSDTSPTGSATDCTAGPVRQPSKTQPKTDARNDPRKSRHHPGNIKKHAKFVEGGPSSSKPRKASSSSKAKSAENQNEHIHYGPARKNPELSFGSADLRKLRDSRYDPEFVRAVGRGDIGNLYPKKRQTSLMSSNDSVLSSSDQNSTLVASDVGSRDSLDTQVDRSLDEQTELNTLRNRGTVPGGSSDMSARDIRRSSLEMARRNLNASISPRTMERYSRHNSDRRRPVFSNRPNNGKLTSSVETQGDLERDRQYDTRNRNRHYSDPTPSLAYGPRNKTRTDDQGRPKTGQSAYQRPSVSEADQSE